jgi:hypothetical protein
MANHQVAAYPPPGHATAADNHKTFTSYYMERAQAPEYRDYQRILDHFDPDVNGVVSHVYLLEQAVSSGPIPQAYLCCAERQQQTKIFCIHLPSKYARALNGDTTSWDGQCFVYLGEITQGVVTTIQLPDNAFRTISNVYAKTSDYMATPLNELTEYGFPGRDGDPDVNQVTTRRIMYLPPRYAHLLLSPAGYTLRQAWEILYPALVDAQDLQNCSALLKWLRVAATSTELAGNVTGLSAAVLDLQAPLADQHLINHRAILLNQVLPAL